MECVMIRCNLFVLTLSVVVLSACSNDKGRTVQETVP